MADTPAQPLTPQVIALVEALLPPGTPGGEELLRQIPHSTMATGCGCGCATLNFVVDRSVVPPAPVLRQRPAAEAMFDGGYGGIMIFADDGYLSCLEVYSFRDEPYAELPAPDQLNVAKS